MAIGSLLSTLGFAAVKAEAKAAARRAGRRAALGAITALLLLLAFGFGLAAFTVWLTHRVGTVPALLIVAGVALVVAGIVQLIAAAGDKTAAGGHRARRRSPPPRSRARPATASPRPDPFGSMAVVAMVGFILAQKLTRKT